MTKKLGKLTAESLKTIRALDEVIDQNKLTRFVMVDRWADTDSLNQMIKQNESLLQGSDLNSVLHMLNTGGGNV